MFPGMVGSVDGFLPFGLGLFNSHALVVVTDHPDVGESREVQPLGVEERGGLGHCGWFLGAMVETLKERSWRCSCQAELVKSPNWV